MLNMISRLFFLAKFTLRKLATFCILLLTIHPRSKNLARRILRTVPGAHAIATRLRRSLPGAPQAGSATVDVPVFEPEAIQPDGVVTVEGLYYLSRSL